MKPASSCLLLLTIFLTTAASGAVRETRAQSFVIETVAMADARPDAVYRLLIRPARWWDPAHTWSKSSTNLTLNARAGGCFCEKLSGGGSVQHGRVLYADPGKLLRLDAPLGPFQDMGVRAVLTFKLEPDGPGTRVTMTYLVAGDIDGPRMAPMVDQVMGGQMARLIAAARR